MALTVAAAAHFVLDFFTQGRLTPLFACAVPTLSPSLGHWGFNLYWTLLTYPIAQEGGEFINTVFLCMWLWSIGGSLERSWGSASFSKFFATVTVATSVVLCIGGWLLRQPYLLAGLSLPIVAVTVAWAALNPYEELLFFFVIRMKAWVLALLVVGFMLFLTFRGAPLLGLFALVNPLIGYLWVRGRLPFKMPSVQNLGGKRRPDLRFYDVDRAKGRNPAFDEIRKRQRNPIDRFNDWRERRRLQKLWRDSGFTDDDEPDIRK